MDNKEKLKDRIKRSLDNALSTVDLKSKIESDIRNIMEMIHELTDGEIGFNINNNSPIDSNFRDCEKLIFLHKTSVNFPYGFNIIGYKLNYESGYPVILETQTEYFDCNNESELSDVIANIIEKKSLQIIQLVSEKVENIPF